MCTRRLAFALFRAYFKRMITSDLIDNPHGFFDRSGGVSSGIYAGLNCGPGSEDDPANVAENRRIVSARIAGRRDWPLLSAYQIHSNIVHTVTDTPTSADTDARPKCDALVTTRPDVILGILTADCAPVLFEDAEAGVIGAAHAGWRGATSGITDNTLDAMVRLGARLERISAVIGPAIQSESYEVGEDMRRQALDADSHTEGFFSAGERDAHYQFDLTGYISARLKRAGAGRIAAVGVDTYTNEQFFSYRRTTHRREPDYGRHISCIMLRPS